MEDYEIKRAYRIVYEDLKETCQVRNQCTNCPIKEACDTCNEALFGVIGRVKEKLFGKEYKNE